MRRHHSLRSELKAGLKKGRVNRDALGQGSTGTDRRWTKLGTSLAAAVPECDRALVFWIGGGDGTALSLRMTFEWTTLQGETGSVAGTSEGDKLGAESYYKAYRTKIKCDARAENSE